MRVLVTGDRHWDDDHVISTLLLGYSEAAAFQSEVLYVIQGGQRGADELARTWAEQALDVESITEHADWERYGLAAGPIRNRKMIDEHEPEVVLAFHNNLPLSKGTRDCVKYAREQGIPVYVISKS
jgi:phosphoserine phosphatase